MNIQESKWNVQAALYLEPACNDEYSINDLAFDVQKGNCQLFNVYEDGHHVASMVLRLESNTHSKELVVVALGGGHPSGALIQSLSAFWDKLAKSNGAKTVRAHVSRKGMARLMERVGGKLTEFVYKREVA